MSMAANYIYCGKISATSEWRMKKHFHQEHHEIIVVLKGVIVTEICGQKIRGSAGDVLFYPAGISHEENADENLPLETYYFGIATQGKPEDCKNIGPVFDRYGRLRFLAQWMCDLSNMRVNPEIGLLNSLAYAVIREWDFLNEPAEPDFVQAAKKLVEKNMTGRIELPDMAKAAGLSVSRFAHVFRKHTGIAPVEYLRRRRMEFARSLLLSTPLAIKEIAERSGCADQYVFSKMFKRIMGVPPGLLRKAR
jgi:AraC-like DNA-binding protein